MAYHEVGTKNTYEAYLEEMKAYRHVPLDYEGWKRLYTKNTKENATFI